MYCPYCGTENADQAEFCQSCGAKITGEIHPSQAGKVTCPQCTRENEATAKFCQYCGVKLSATEGYSSAPTAAAMAMPPRIDYAGFWRRFVAVIIDSIILGIVAGAISLITGGPEMPSSYETMGPGIFKAFAFTNFLSILIWWLYFALMESSSKQATIGKMALGLLVTDLQGRRISFGRATGRHFSKIISSAILLIGYIMAGITARKQALHDMIAGTLVLVSR